ncbi:SMAD/FHA domain-containing protein [Sodiomyces alkalinus F11]|uniref:RING-type E3 ubiquitin transferase n=1 Tax=Sodiomyces alkalinus (strain CBS 110278 / VKM F-3762 / F11) TaxID=1314773 RepID=A0A3N2PVC7_SODAK|nr:SMAD/FHA domain-containing protein [Sodiomyces alkalinus F11]ROT38449.1 SMAD/FHA domain-containing protein [Sodiomyces alkalinus F11]
MNGTGLPETGSPPETTPPQAAPTGAAGSSTSPSEPLPSIRFSAYFDPRATRPSLSFSPIARTLPTGTEQIRVGRYSERDAQPNVPSNVPSSSPVGFKSKVVSRRHCEFWYEGGKWYIKDVKSSSGTFLNHIRLSPPGTESKPFPVNDGDIVQLGIDFKGGEEMIFRCVKMRLELNRGWQNKPNAFNVTTHKRLRIMASAGGDSANSSSQDCSICLNSIAPCQSLFVAPCSHTWHYKCIRSLLNNPQYPIFVCPNCRMAADLEADIEDPEEDWDQVDMDEPVKAEDNADSTPQVDNPPPAPPVPTAPLAPPAPPAPPAPTQPLPRTRDSSGSRSSRDDSDAAREVRRQSSAARLAHMTLIPHSVSQPLAIRPLSMLPRHRSRSNSSTRGRTPSPPTQNGGVEGPITPRNDAGPWVFDGSAAGSRAGSASEGTGMRSLDEAAEGESER